MSLDGTYTGLKASLTSWLHRNDMTAVIPDLIVLAEERINRELRVKDMIVEASVNTVAGVQEITIPTDWLELENVSITTPVQQLTYVNIEHLDSKYPSDYTGQPIVYTVEGNEIYFGPTPDAVYPIGLWYYGKPTALASTTGTHTLFNKYPSLYLFGALSEAAPWMRDDVRIPLWEAKFKEQLKTIQKVDDDATHSGSLMRVRRI